MGAPRARFRGSSLHPLAYNPLIVSPRRFARPGSTPAGLSALLLRFAQLEPAPPSLFLEAMSNDDYVFNTAEPFQYTLETALKGC